MSGRATLVRAPAARLVVAVRPLAPDVDPLALHRAVPDVVRFHWERPAERTAIAAVGAVAMAHGEPLPAGAVAVGGFAFDETRAPAGPWRHFPRREWIVPRLAVVRRGDRVHLVAATLGTRDDEPGLADAAARAAAALATPPPVLLDEGSRRYGLAALGTPRGWRRAVEATRADIAAGRLAKLVLARAVVLRAGAPLDPLRAVDRLRRAYPGCATFAVGRGPATFVGATPERLARVAGDRLATAALAGTAPRGAVPAEDRAWATALAANPKDRTEHAVVVDDLRARLTPLCRALRIPAHPRTLRTETLQHLMTPIRARLRPGVGVLDVAAALHPTPAVCGAPRDAARAALAARERLDRGWYAGGVGWFDADGGEVDVALRAGLLEGRRAILYAGAGIVAASDWEAELEETRLKLRALLGALLEL